MFIDDEEKTVKLFIDNLLSGKISTLFHTSYNEEYCESVSSRIDDWRTLNKKNRIIPQDEMEYDYLTQDLFQIYLKGRVNGVIIGLLYDAELEEQQFRQEIKKLNEKIKRVEEGNEELRNHNIALANELEDQKNLINSYEKATMRK